MLFELGETDEYPAWALPLVARRRLWQDYGVVIGEFGFNDFLLAMRLSRLEITRQNNVMKQAGKKPDNA